MKMPTTSQVRELGKITQRSIETLMLLSKLEAHLKVLGFDEAERERITEPAMMAIADLLKAKGGV